VILKEGEVEQHAPMTKLSEGGMAVRTARALKHNALIDFDFDRPTRASVTGRGPAKNKRRNIHGRPRAD
jgi:hypothetical protein